METLIRIVKTLGGFENWYKLADGSIKIEFVARPCMKVA